MSYKILAVASLCQALMMVSGLQADDCSYECRTERAVVFLPENILPLLRGVSEQKKHTSHLAEVHWYGNSKAFWYVRETVKGMNLHRMRVDQSVPEVLLSSRQMIEKVRQKFGVTIALDDVAEEALSYSPHTNEARLTVGHMLYVFNLNADKVHRSDVKTELYKNKNDAFSPDGQFKVFTKDHNLFVKKQDREVRQLSDNGEQWYSFEGRFARSNPLFYHDQPAKVPRIMWIGKGPNFIIERWDHRHVGDVWMQNALVTRGGLQQQKMSYPGDKKIPKAEIWVFDAETGTGRVIRDAQFDYVGSMDYGSGGVFPLRDGQHIYFTKISRNYSRIELARLTLETGNVETVLKEEGAPQPGNDTPFFGVRWPKFVELSDGFLWKSDRDGFPHFYLYDKDGTYVRQITHGNFAIDRILHVDETKGLLYFSAFGNGTDSPYHTRLFKAHLNETNVIPLEAEDMVHSAQVSPDGNYIVDTISSVSQPPKMVLRDEQGTIISVVATTDTTALEASGWKAPEIFEVKAADGRTPLYGVLWKPFHMKTGEKLPIITRVYPGPANEIVPVGFWPSHPNTALSQLGFVVVTMGQRGGSQVRGRGYQLASRSVYKARDYPIADNKAAIEQLAARHDFIDSSRVGIVGRSGGGFMAATAMLLEPDFYKVGVSIAGNHDNNIYEMNSSEFHFGTPTDKLYPTNAELAGNLKGHLMLAHGDLDDDVSIGHSLRLIRSLQEAGKKFDFVMLPGERHHYRPVAARYLRFATWDYFLAHLAGMNAQTVNLVR